MEKIIYYFNNFILLLIKSYIFLNFFLVSSSILIFIILLTNFEYYTFFQIDFKGLSNSEKEIFCIKWLQKLDNKNSSSFFSTEKELQTFLEEYLKKKKPTFSDKEMLIEKSRFYFKKFLISVNEKNAFLADSTPNYFLIKFVSNDRILFFHGSDDFSVGIKFFSPEELKRLNNYDLSMYHRACTIGRWVNGQSYINSIAQSVKEKMR